MINCQLSWCLTKIKKGPIFSGKYSCQVEKYGRTSQDNKNKRLDFDILTNNRFRSAWLINASAFSNECWIVQKI